MDGLSPRVRRFAKRHGFRPTRAVSAGAFDRPLELRSQLIQAGKRVTPDNISCAFDGMWGDDSVEVYAIRESGFGEDDPNS